MGIRLSYHDGRRWQTVNGIGHYLHDTYIVQASRRRYTFNADAIDSQKSLNYMFVEFILKSDACVSITITGY